MRNFFFKSTLVNRGFGPKNELQTESFLSRLLSQNTKVDLGGRPGMYFAISVASRNAQIGSVPGRPPKSTLVSWPISGSKTTLLGGHFCVQNRLH